jgi:hypothetical protein
MRRSMNLDISALEAASEFWEFWGYIATGLVLAGVIGEFVTELTHWIKDRAFRKLVEKTSVLILIIGIAGEILCQVQSNNNNSLIVGILDKEAAQAKLELAKIREPRIIKPEQRNNLIASLRKYEGKGFWIQVERAPSHQYGEQIDFAEQLRSVFVEARWKLTQYLEPDGKPVPPDIAPNGDHGCSLASATEPKSAELLSAVGEAFKNDADIECRQTTDSSLPANLIVLEIAPK